MDQLEAGHYPSGYIQHTMQPQSMYKGNICFNSNVREDTATKFNNFNRQSDLSVGYFNNSYPKLFLKSNSFVPQSIKYYHEPNMEKKIESSSTYQNCKAYYQSYWSGSLEHKK